MPCNLKHSTFAISDTKKELLLQCTLCLFGQEFNTRLRVLKYDRFCSFITVTLSFTRSVTTAFLLITIYCDYLKATRGMSSQTVVQRRGGSQCSLTASNRGSKKKKKIIKNKIKHVNLQNMYDFCLFRTFTETERNRGANAKQKPGSNNQNKMKT